MFLLEKNATVARYDAHHQVIQEGRHTYRIYISSVGYPDGFLFEADSMQDLSDQWLSYCVDHGFCNNKNIGRITIVK